MSACVQRRFQHVRSELATRVGVYCYRDNHVARRITSVEVTGAADVATASVAASAVSSTVAFTATVTATAAGCNPSPPAPNNAALPDNAITSSRAFRGWRFST